MVIQSLHPTELDCQNHLDHRQLEFTNTSTIFFTIRASRKYVILDQAFY